MDLSAEDTYSALEPLELDWLYPQGPLELIKG
jgi:hypothetical protein